jgi:hypothetical protein
MFADSSVMTVSSWVDSGCATFTAQVRRTHALPHTAVPALLLFPDVFPPYLPDDAGIAHRHDRSGAQPAAGGLAAGALTWLLLFIGVRSDPFFGDPEGYAHGFQFTGQDAFANKNVLCIALEVPNDMLFGAGPAIGVWATVSLRRDDLLVQVERDGHPSINPLMTPNDAKDEYNVRQPVDDVANYLKPWSEILQDHGYAPDEATAAVLTVLPDILRYDSTRPAAYPNGRLLTDDPFSAAMAFLTHGQVTSSGLRPHDDLLAQFPFLGLPNALPAI